MTLIDASRQHVLVVDDEPLNRKLFRALVTANGYVPIDVESAEEAIALLEEGTSVDTIVLDVSLPGASGIELTQRLKGDPELRHIPIILITALQDESIRREGLLAGAEDFLTKPVDRVEFGSRLRNLLRLRHYSAALEAQNQNLNAIVLERTRELRLAAQFLRCTLDAMPSHIAILDEALTILQVNKAWRSFGEDHGLTLANYGIGASYLETLSADSPVLRGLMGVVRGELQSFSHTYPCHGPDAQRWFTLEVNRFDQEGRPFLVVAHHNVTEQHLANQRLRDNESLYRGVVETAPDLIALLDGEHRIRFISRLHRLEDDQVVGRSALDFVVPKHRSVMLESLNKAWDSPGEIVTFQLQALTPEGEPLWYSNRARRITLQGEEDRILLFSSDITERMETEEALQISQRHSQQSQRLEALGLLAGGISHDFNNILAVIKGYASFLQRGVREDPSLSSDVQQIIEATSRASKLTHRLLAFSRRSPHEPTSIQLNGLIRELEPMLRRLIEERVQIHFNLRDELPNIVVDAGQIEQVVMNLIINARDAMPQGGTLTVGTSLEHITEEEAARRPGVKSGRFVALTVRDTGIGMSEETLSRVFEPFFTTKSPEKGTGLGLATAYGIVQQSDGSITVSSELGKGTLFSVYFPVLATVGEESLAPRDVKRMSQATVAEGLVLLVEDEDMVRDIVRRVLHEEGYQVITASNAGEALLLVERIEGELALLLTDIVMPVMNGVELYERLKQQRPDLRVLFMTGYVDDIALEYGVTHSKNLIEKPFAPDDLAQAVAQVIATGEV